MKLLGGDCPSDLFSIQPPMKNIRPKPGSVATEAARCAYLHQLCQEIERLIAEGMTARAAIKRMARRQRSAIFKNRRISWQNLRMLFYRWRKANRSPEAFRRRYKYAHLLKLRVPIALLMDFLNRMAGPQIVSAATALRSLLADWERGRSIPGIGTWREYVRRKYGEAGSRTTPPRFPVAVATFYNALAAYGRGDYQERIAAALRAQRELAHFSNFIERNRSALEKRRAHEPLGDSFPQKS